MKFIKKSFKIFKENFFILFGIEVIFFLVAYLLINFLVGKIFFYFKIIKSLMPELEALKGSVESLSNSADLVQFNNLIGVVGESISKILLISALLIFGFYLLWCFFQSTSWRLSYTAVKKKLSLKNFFKNLSWKYFLRFSLISLIFLILIFPFLFQILVKLKGFILNHLISKFNLTETFSNTGSIGEVSILILILLFLIYLIMLVYMLLNENTIFKAVKKAFLMGIKKFYLFFVVLLCLATFFALLFLVRINLFLSFGLIFIFYIYFRVLMNVLVRE